MTTGRGYISDEEIAVLQGVLIDEILNETVHNRPSGVEFSVWMVKAGLWRAIRKGALDDILYNRGVDFDEYDE